MSKVRFGITVQLGALGRIFSVVGLVLLVGVFGTPAAKAQSARCSHGEDSILSMSGARFSLQGSAFAQIHYAAALKGTELVRSDFTVPRARICGSGHAFTSRLRYRLMIGRSVQREIEINDAFVEWEPIDGLAFRIGRFKLPIIREWIESAQALATVDRALASRLLLPGRDYGVRVGGRLWRQRLEYLVGVWNGDGETLTHAVDTSPAVVARLSLHLTGNPYSGAVDFDGRLPHVTVETGLLWNRWKPPSSATPAPQVEDTLWNASALFRWAHFDGACEYIGQKRTDSQKTIWTHGGYLRLTYLVPLLRSSFTGRASVVAVRGDKPSQQVEAEANWGVYLDRHRAKLIARYGVLHDQVPATVEHQLGILTQISVY